MNSSSTCRRSLGAALPKRTSGPADRHRVGITVTLLPIGVSGLHKVYEFLRVHPGDRVETEILRPNHLAQFCLVDPLHDAVHPFGALERRDKLAVNQFAFAEVKSVFL